MSRVLVCGSRTFNERWLVGSLLTAQYHLTPGPFTVIEGGACGADRIAHDWATNGKHDVEHEQYPADWETYGPAAGPIRNQEMLDAGKPDMVLAFVDKPLAQSRGTNDMVTRSRKAGLPTYVVEV